MFFGVITGSLYTTAARVLADISADGELFHQNIIRNFDLAHRKQSVADSLTEIVNCLHFEQSM